MLKRYPQALMVFFFGTSLLTGCASTEKKEALNQNLSASNSLHANGGDMCPPGHTVFKYGNCYPRGTGCKPDYNWLEPNLCRKKPCPDGYNKRVDNKCYQKINSLSAQKTCSGQHITIRSDVMLCKKCDDGYQKFPMETLSGFGPLDGIYHLCFKCNTGTPFIVTGNRDFFCHTSSTSVQLIDEYSLPASPPKRNCSDLPVTVCGGAAFSHCVVRGEGDNRRCAWNVAPHYPYCEINGGGATCYDME